jgi:hypothetical protein
MEVPTKQELLEHYDRHEPRPFIQLDGFDAGNVPDVEFEGEPPIYIEGALTHELVCGDFDMRVLIKPGTSKETALLLLEHMRDAIELNGVPDVFEVQRQVELVAAANEALDVLRSINEAGGADLAKCGAAANRLSDALQELGASAPVPEVTEHVF